MNSNEKERSLRVTEAMSILPEEKQEFMFGYAEGIIAMSRQRAPEYENSRQSERAG